ncbi:uncharacterized protein LAJ45_03133 [Morchella importuna]|uniref:UPF0016-domain-containing protein n=1 Tax=Morchella conica CCBAS932 TaxID=1392247 RepID=A0A3N4KU34_9PEZI|nr:uncharacterized protein LAJ45_03133 [Morchella importuna]KAH8152907.1 hypothetical protein LAJ45_03133 [Morchella importuna]RPB12998.1 UPF0016-domain-containing protein [Morchella conica CCBAS932]
MHLKTRDLLLLLLTSSTALASTVPPPRSATDLKTSAGTVDAPVDGLDGKPHTGPGLYPEHSDKKGTGEVGVSGGGSSVDIKKPPPHTGEHEIVDIEDPAEGDESSMQLSLKKGAKTASSDDDDDDDDDDHTGSSSGPVSSSGHKEYQSQTDTLADPPAAAQPHLSPQDDDGDGGAGGISQPLHSFTLSFVMIIFSEIGDKTFLIAALMAMKHPRLLVFSAALGSLIVMSILSALLGHAVPTLLPKNFTNFLAAGLFLVFGVRMVLEGLKMEKGTANVQEEMKEVEQELEEKASHSGVSARSLEGGLIASPRGSNTHALRRSTSSPSLSDSDEDDYARARGRGGKAQNTRVTSLEGIQNLAGLLLSPAWVQTFVMTFLGEWGDRSQIATIAMAAGQDYWYVTIGAISGHAICTGIAVIGGRMLASRISVRNVTLGGAAAFLAFGVIYLGEALFYGSS